MSLERDEMFTIAPPPAVSTMRGMQSFASRNACVTFVRSAFSVFFQAEDGIRDLTVTGVQTCALPICAVLVALDGFLAPYKVVRYDIDRDLQGWRPPAGKRDKHGTEIEDRIYNQRDFDQIGRASCRERV